MNISGYPDFFDEVNESVSCYNCSNDCNGIFDIIMEGGSYE